MIGKSFLIFFVGLNLMAFNLLGSKDKIEERSKELFFGKPIDVNFLKKIAYTNAEKNFNFFLLITPPFEKKFDCFKKKIQKDGCDMENVLKFLSKKKVVDKHSLDANSRIKVVESFFESFFSEKTRNLRSKAWEYDKIIAEIIKANLLRKNSEYRKNQIKKSNKMFN